MGSGFAVIDIETTGLFPTQHDRIVEIGIVHVSSTGDVTGRWGTETAQRKLAEHALTEIPNLAEPVP